MAETQVKQKESKKGRIILIILIIIILLLTLFVGCFAQKLLHETNLKEQAKESAERYLKEHQLQFDGDVSIPMNLLKEANYLGYFDSKCLDASYVIVRKNGDKLEYEPIIVCDSSKAILKLNGNALKQLEVGEDYIEEGATVESDSIHDVIIDGNVDTSKKGTYGVTYKIPDTDIPPVLRVVEVVDTTKPILTLKNSDILYLAVGDTYTEPGYKAIDNYDGDITNQVKITGTVNTKKAGTYTIIYKVTDSSNNTTEITRQIIVRENVPTINLKGYGTVYVDVFGTYTEEGYTATDIKGNNLTKQVIVSGTVNTNVVGDYVITYKVTNSNGATATVRRTVKVVDNTKPEITLNGDKEVILEWGKDTYVEMGATATDNYDGDISTRINITGVFNPNKVGTYYLAYTVTDASGNKTSVQRIVKVVDTEAPTVTLKGNDPMYIEAGSQFTDPGVEATDNYDSFVKVETAGIVNINVLGTYTITYTAIDNSGNKIVVTRQVIVQDTTAPVITLKGDATTTVEFGTSYVEPGYTATDNYDQFVQNKVVIGGDTVDVNTEGTYTITYDVTDNNGNIATTVTRTVIVKDTKAPIVTLTSDDMNKFVQNANVTLKAYDTNHGLQTVRYAWKQTEPTTDEYIDLTYVENAEETMTFAQNGTYYLWVEATDLSGNVTVEKIGPFKIDVSAPEISFTPNGSIGQNITVQPTITDNFSGVKEIYYAWSDSNSTQPTEFTTYTGGSFTKDTDGTYYLWIKAVDNAGNEEITVSNAFIVDNAYPSITFTYPTTSTVVKTAIVDVTAMGNSGKTITKVEYQWTKTNVQPTTGYTEWTDYDANHTITMPADLDGNYYLWIKATDSYGLVSYNSSRMITIDNTAPTITVTPETSTTPVQSIDVNITVVEENIESILWAVSTDNNINNVTLTNSLTELTSKITLEGLNGTYYLHIGVLDKAGNYTDYTSQAFEFDNTAPDAPTITFDENWTNQPVSVTITGTDTIEYSFDNKTWVTYIAPFTVSANTTIYTKSSDVAGNISDVASKEITNIDTALPTLTLTYKTTLTNKLSVDYSATDTNSGIQTIYYAWSTSDVVAPEFTETLTDATGTVTKNDINGTYALWIKVVDKAGNETTKHTSLLTLDKEKPIIDITTGNGTTTPVTSQDTTVNITDDSTLTIEYIYSTSSEALDDTANWTSWYDYNKDTKNTLTLNNKFTDGTYYLHIKATDAAGNSEYVISNAFTLVNSKPNVIYNPATNLDYQQQISSTVTATLDGATIQGLYYAWSTATTADTITEWTPFDSGDTITKDDVTGAYYLYVKVVDNVDGNRETIIKSTGTFNLDKSNVQVSFDPNGTGTPVKEAETEIKATDIHSGINTIKYAWGTSSTKSPDLSQFVDYTLGTTITKTTTDTYETYYLWVYAKDEAGNENYTVSDAFIIDNSYPTIDLDPNRSNPVNDLTVNVTIDVDSNKTLTRIYYAWDTNSSITDSTAWTEWDIDDYYANPKLSQTGLNGTYYLHVKVVDNHDMEATKSTYALEFDNTPADVTITPGANTTPVQTMKPTITVTETPSGNDYTVYYSFTQEANHELAIYTEWTDFMGQGKDTLTLGDSTTNGTWYLHIKVIDEAFNITYETVAYEFDNEAPDAPSISYDTTWTNQGVEITINGDEILEYSFDNKTWATYDATNKPTVSTKGTIIYARSKDEAGNISEVENVTIENIDKTAPVVTVTPSTTDWTNKNVTLTVNITDDGLSPIKSIRWAPVALTKEEYQAGRGNAVSLDTKKFENGINHEYVEIYVEDEAGNITIIHTSVTNIDKEAPVITVNPEEVTINENTTYDVLTGVSATDNVGFGDNQLTYETDFDYKTPGTYTVTYKITDMAGTTSTATRTIIVKDITAPSLDLTYEEGSHQELEVKYEASDNVAIKEMYYAWSTSATEEPIFVNTLTDAKGIITKNDVEGTYALWIKVVDESGNKTVKHTNLLTLDKTAPVITIDPESKEKPVQNISPIIKVEEDNTYDVYYSFTQETDPEAATYTKWENFKGDDTDTKKFGETTNGQYYIHIKVVDAAGNTTYATATYEFDNIAPAKPSISYDTTWTNQDVEITIDGDEILEYSFDNKTWIEYDATNKPSVSVNNTTIYARSKDEAGNISEVENVTIENIDKTAPVITIDPESKEKPVQNISPIIKVEENNTYDVYYSFTQETDPEVATYTKWENFKGDDTDTKKFGETTNGQYYIHIKVVDAAGNTTYATATYEFDNIAPAKPSISYDTTWTNQDVEITIDGDEILEYSFDNKTWIEYDATNKPSVSVNNTTIYARSKDEAGNISEVENVTIENIDKTAPVVTVTPNTTDWTNQDVTLTLDITEDNLSPIKSIRWAPIALTKEDYQNGRGFEVDLTTRKFTQGISREYVEIYVEDEAGNTTIISTSVTNIDKEAPELIVNPDTVTIDEGTKYDVLEGVSATDNVGIKGEIEVTTDFDYKTPGTYTATYKVSDLAGTEIVKTRTIIVKDITKPNLELVGDSEITIEVGGTYTELGATAIDNVDGDISANIEIEGSVDTTVVDTYTITYTVEDTAGNSITITRTVKVVDTTKPEITLNGNEVVTIEVGGTYTELGATATDNYDGDITSKIIITGTVNTNVVGTYTVKYNVVDANENEAEEVTRTVKVVDTTKPVISLIGDATIDVEVFGTYTELGATATDNYDGDITSQIITTITPLGKVDTTVLGTYIIKYNVVDANGNVAEEVTRTVNVVDKTEPILKLKGTTPVIIEVGGTYHELGATAVDNYDGNLTDNIVISSTVDTTTVGSYYVRYSVTDASGNTATILRKVEVVDTTKPEITLNGDKVVTVEVGGTYTELGATATDNYDGNLTNLIEIEGSVDTNVVDTYEITYTVEDSNGNSQTVTRTVKVVDTTDPEIELVGDDEITIEVGSDYEELGAIASDNYDGDLTDFIEIDGEVDTETVGTYTITYKVEDESGNSASITRIVKVVDTTKPEITLKGESNVTIQAGTEYIDLGATANDNYDGDITANIQTTVTSDNGLNYVNTTKLGTYTITYNVTDSKGNIAVSVTRTVKVIDTTIPEIILKGESNVTIQAGTEYIDLGATANDNLDGDITANIQTTVTSDNGLDYVDTTKVGTYTIAYNVTDSEGNVATTVTRTVKVVDTKEPIITIVGKEEVTIEVGGIYTELGATVTDNHDTDLTSKIVTTVTSDNGLDYIDTTKVGTYTIAYDVTDSEGNVATTVTRTVKVVDTTIPEITLDGDTNITLTIGKEYLEPGYTADDNYDGDITGNVVVNGKVNTTKVGTYTLTYTVKDANNNAAVEVIRTVTIIADSAENLFRDNNECEVGTDCFSTPDSENNYFWYSGYLFRAFKSNADGSIKLITEGSISSLSYDDDSSIFKASIIENWLNTTFYNSLHNADNFLVTSKFCNWNTTKPDNNRTTCDAAALVEAKVGLLTLFEYNLVGGKNSYLSNQDRFFTMTRYGAKSVWAINSDGTPVQAEMVESIRAIRPVITLASGIDAVEGDGTKENPYRLAGDTAASSNTALNDRYTGEYVKFNDQVWRIVSTDNNGTKMILDSFLKDAEGNVIEVAYGETTRYSESNVLKELTAYYQGNNNLVNTAWYWGSYTRGKNPIGTSLRTDGNYSNHQFGLIRVGELMSGKSATLENSGMTYWTMTENTEENTVWHISSTGGASYDTLSALRAIRPVIKIDSNKLIVSGNGTSANPYIVK